MFRWLNWFRIHFNFGILWTQWLTVWFGEGQAARWPAKKYEQIQKENTTYWLTYGRANVSVPYQHPHPPRRPHGAASLRVRKPTTSQSTKPLWVISGGIPFLWHEAVFWMPVVKSGSNFVSNYGGEGCDRLILRCIQSANQHMHTFNFLFIKTYLKFLKTLLHVSVIRPSSGSL